MSKTKHRLHEDMRSPTNGTNNSKNGINGKNSINGKNANNEKPIVGMVHLPALPGSPGFLGDLDGVFQQAATDAHRLVEAGFTCLMMENFGDTPFFPKRVPRHVVAFMTALARHLRETVKGTPYSLGINVLRNDGLSALEVAAASGASFIRVNVLAGARLTDQGIVEGIAHDLLRLRETLHCPHISILADVSVKHSSPLAPVSLEEDVEDLITRARADALVVTGSGTGHPADVETAKRVRQVALDHSTATGALPIFLGSGVTLKNLEHYWPHVDGVIVGSSIKEDGLATSPVSFSKAKAFMEKVYELESA